MCLFHLHNNIHYFIFGNILCVKSYQRISAGVVAAAFFEPASSQATPFHRAHPHPHHLVQCPHQSQYQHLTVSRSPDLESSCLGILRHWMPRRGNMVIGMGNGTVQEIGVGIGVEICNYWEKRVLGI